jgi:hypothetical protein
VGKYADLIQRILGGRADASIKFSELRQLLLRLGFDERVRGDHHIFTKENVEEILNLQPKRSMAKPYQVRQVRNLILRYRLGVEEDVE